MESKNDAMEVVLSYIRALDNQEYDNVGGFLSKGIRIKGPAGESFAKPGEFIEMLRSYKGKYDVKKTFADGDDVCLLYDLATPVGTAFMCSWYQVNDRKITSITTIFDPGAFGPSPTSKNA